MADVKWIKLTTDIFDNEKILMIESLPSADTILVIWFKLLTLAGKSNNNGVFMMSNRIPYTDGMLAAIFRRDEKVVKLALKTFEQFGMIEIVDDVITIPNWDKHQSLDAYEKKKERDRKLQAERRAKQKLLVEKSSDNRLTSCDSSSDVAVSDIEEEKEEEININNNTNVLLSGAENSATEQKPPKKPSVIDLTLNTGELYGIDEDSVKEWESLYPAVNVMQELRNMKGWLDANPTRRKTKSGIKRFINNWLSKEQNKGGVNNAKPYGASSERNSGYDEIQFGLHL